MIAENVGQTKVSAPTDPLRRLRIRRLSLFMAGLSAATAALLPTCLILFWLLMPAETMSRAGASIFDFASGVDLSTRLAALAISAIPMAALVYGLVSARRCFLAFAQGKILSIASVANMRRLAFSVLISALLKPVVGAALSVLFSWHAAPGMRRLSLDISSDLLLSMIFAGTIAIIAWVMMDAITIADENAQFV